MGARRWESEGQGGRGAALVLCMFMTATVLSSVTVMSLRAVAHVRHSQYAAWRVAAVAGAEVVLDATRIALEQGRPGTVGFSGDHGPLLAGLASPPPMDAPGIVPQVVDGAPELVWYAAAGPASGATGENVVIVAVAKVHGVHAAVEGTYRRETGSPALRRLTWRERTVSGEALEP